MKNYATGKMNATDEEMLTKVSGCGTDVVETGEEMVEKGLDVLKSKTKVCKCPRCKMDDMVEVRAAWRVLFGANRFHCNRCDYSYDYTD